MTLKEREKSFETKFILDEEKEFKAKAMASKLFGLWAAEEMKMAPKDINIYTKSLIDLSIASKDFDPIIDHVNNDLLEAGIQSDKSKLEEVFFDKLENCKSKLSN
ncbi:MAG: DUF1476 domain-containing protein [Rickettsiales bacterium]|jgi:hypothetical protein|nr:DUF1476 domain-containing protein [Rickettsiales bacterium]